MRNQTILLSLLASSLAGGCKPLECADGTIERDGMCFAPDTEVPAAKCGPFTEVVNDKCVPMFPPTECDPSSTEANVDPTTGVTTCIGTSTGDSCGAPSASGKQTICGQIYDFETNLPFASSSDCKQCDPAMPTATGPCALKLRAYNAVDFAGGAPTELSVGKVFLDTCGKYKLQEVDTNAAGPFIGIGVDDAAGLGPTGVTVTAAVAVKTVEKTAVKDFEAWIVKPQTAAGWGNNLLMTGVYAAVYRAHKVKPNDPTQMPADLLVGQAGVKAATNTATNPTPVPAANDFYFGPTAADRMTITTDASTGVNGTALVNNASLAQNLYYGAGGLGTGCIWEGHAAASLPGIVFIQVFRKLAATPGSCND